MDVATLPRRTPDLLVEPHAHGGLPEPVRTPASGPLPSLLARLGGSMAVSVATTLWSLSILTVLTASGLTSATVANVVATLAGIPWSYTLNRRFVWRRTDRHDVRREVLPFVAMCVLALVASTLAVHAADAWATGLHLRTAVRTVVVVGANVASFGLLWVAQFLVLDRVLFRRR